jgi:hypothetical protein
MRRREYTAAAVDFLAWIETSALGIWVRESPSILAFPGILVLHAIGMAFLAGTNAALDLRILGFAPGVPLMQLEKFFPVMWFGLAVNTVSGVLLAAAYPIKAFTNPIFYLKLICIAIGLVLTVWIRKWVVRDPAANTGSVFAKGRLLAAVSLAVWAGAIFSGRFLAYTCRWLMLDIPC